MTLMVFPILTVPWKFYGMKIHDWICQFFDNLSNLLYSLVTVIWILCLLKRFFWSIISCQGKSVEEVYDFVPMKGPKILPTSFPPSIYFHPLQLRSNNKENRFDRPWGSREPDTSLGIPYRLRDFNYPVTLINRYSIHWMDDQPRWWQQYESLLRRKQSPFLFSMDSYGKIFCYSIRLLDFSRSSTFILRVGDRCFTGCPSLYGNSIDYGCPTISSIDIDSLASFRIGKSRA
jgi:hypothetical protein